MSNNIIIFSINIMIIYTYHIIMTTGHTPHFSCWLQTAPFTGYKNQGQVTHCCAGSFQRFTSLRARFASAGETPGPGASTWPWKAVHSSEAPQVAKSAATKGRLRQKNMATWGHFVKRFKLKNLLYIYIYNYILFFSFVDIVLTNHIISFIYII